MRPGNSCFFFLTKTFINAGHTPGTCLAFRVGPLLSMKEILSDLVSTGTARNGNRNYRTGFVLLEERNQRLHEHRLKSGHGVGNVGLHAKIAGQIDGRIAQVKRALRSTSTPGISRMIRCVERTPSCILAWPLNDETTSAEASEA